MWHNMEKDENIQVNDFAEDCIYVLISQLNCLGSLLFIGFAVMLGIYWIIYREEFLIQEFWFIVVPINSN